MPSDFLFRVSTFAMLTVACLSLGYAEWDLLPEVTVVGVIVVALLLFPFWKREKIELSLWAANRVGLGLSVVIAAWMAYQFLNESSLIYTLPWPASLLPYLGPILMALMAAKMFRPKHVGDWWAFQGIGLASVALACALANDEGFGVLLVLYAITAVWSLLLFTYRREGGRLAPIPNRPPPGVPELSRTTLSSRVPGLAAGVCCLLLAVLLATPFFFLTPRSSLPRWTFGQQTLETGYNSAPMVDLNTTGTLTSNNEVAFQAEARRANGSLKNDLPSDQYWRGANYNSYDNGKWKRTEGRLGLYRRAGPFQAGIEPNAEMLHSRYIPPDLGMKMYTIDFHRVAQEGDAVIAAPPAWKPGQFPPIVTLSNEQTRSWWQAQDASLRPAGWSEKRLDHYRQYHVEPTEPGLGPAMELLVDPDPDNLLLRRPFASFQQATLPKVKTWAIERINDLVQAGTLNRGVIQRAKRGGEFQIHVNDYEAVARALCDYLKTSPEFDYTLELTRDERGTDPIEDFLLRTKSGHCQRFASGLALALRSVGVPTTYVLGFRGYDQDADGTIEITQDYAHAWVEVLIPRPRPADMPLHRDDTRSAAMQAVVWHWLILDPTPGDDVEQTKKNSWLAALRDRGAELFNDFIVGYNDKKHKEVSTAFWSKLLRTRTLVGLGLTLLVLITAIYTLRYGIQRRAATRSNIPRSTGVPWYDDYLRLLNEHDVHPKPGATPREFAEAVTERLESVGLSSAIVHVPHELTEQFHHVRYAEGVLTPEVEAALHARIDQLRQALSASDTPLSVKEGAA